jgi:hypothetical protein
MQQSNGENDDRYVTSKISNLLFELQHLSYRNLSGINFKGNPFLYFFGSLKKLRYLDLFSIVLPEPSQISVGTFQDYDILILVVMIMLILKVLTFSPTFFLLSILT